MLVERCGAKIDGARGKTVVGVQEHDELPAAFAQPTVAGRREPRALLPHAPERVPGLEGRNHVGRRVRAAVVHDDDLGGDVGRADARERFGEVGAMVVAGDHDRDQRRAGHTHLSITNPERCHDVGLISKTSSTSCKAI